MKAKAVRIAATMVLTALLAGCYLPIRFDAEIEVTRNGYYSVVFDGYLVSVPLFRGLREGTISPLEENEKVATIVNDFKRDKAVKEIKYFKQARFKVNWQKKGDLMRARMVTFLKAPLKIPSGALNRLESGRRDTGIRGTSDGPNGLF